MDSGAATRFLIRPSVVAENAGNHDILCDDSQKSFPAVPYSIDH